MGIAARVVGIRVSDRATLATFGRSTRLMVQTARRYQRAADAMIAEAYLPGLTGRRHADRGLASMKSFRRKDGSGEPPTQAAGGTAKRISMARARQRDAPFDDRSGSATLSQGEAKALHRNGASSSTPA
jgi:hypothetical protein